MSDNYFGDPEPLKDINISDTTVNFDETIQSDNTSSGLTFFTIIRYFAIIIIILFLVFAVLNSISGSNLTLGMLIDNLLHFVGISAGEITKQTVDASTKGVVDVAESIKKGTDSAVSKLEGRVDSKEPKRDKVKYSDKRAIKKALKHAESRKKNVPVADDNSSSSINRERTQAGYCYVGQQAGIRSCVEVGPNDLCMSGDIFPTQDICINPNLRLGGLPSNTSTSSHQDSKRLPRQHPVGSLLNNITSDKSIEGGDNVLAVGKKNALVKNSAGDYIMTGKDETGSIPSEQKYLDNLNNEVAVQNQSIEYNPRNKNDPVGKEGYSNYKKYR